MGVCVAHQSKSLALIAHGFGWSCCAPRSPSVVAQGPSPGQVCGGPGPEPSRLRAAHGPPRPLRLS
eukprot:12107369-Alexandrium_andersonii.AAC.1